MPNALLVNNELYRQRRKPAEELPRLPKSVRIDGGRPLMTETSEFCQYPGDREGCCRLLLQAWGEGSVDKHCIIEGLRANWHQCRHVLLDGLYDRTSQHKGPADKMTEAVGQKKDLEEACKQVVLFGYPLEIKAIHEVFYEAYYRLVRCIIHRFRIKDDGQPSADDISQDVFANLHEHFRKGRSVKGPLATYIARVTINECFRGLRDAAGRTSLLEEQVEIETSLSIALLPPSVVELWEDLDQQLLHSQYGNLINRIIFAQRCLEACSTGQKLSAKQLMADWQRLSEMSEGYVTNVHRKVTKEVERAPGTGIVHVAADLINAGLAAPYQMAIVFAAGMGMDLEQTEELIERITNLSSNAVYARICRIYTALSPPET